MPNLKTAIVNWLRGLACLPLYLVWCTCELLRPHVANLRRKPTAWWLRRLLLCLLLPLILFCLFALSGCGTRPSPVQIGPRVPAALMVEPQTPTPLVPRPAASASKTPGPTTALTPAPAPLTAPGTAR